MTKKKRKYILLACLILLLVLGIGLTYITKPKGMPMMEIHYQEDKETETWRDIGIGGHHWMKNDSTVLTAPPFISVQNNDNITKLSEKVIDYPIYVRFTQRPDTITVYQFSERLGGQKVTSADGKEIDLHKKGKSYYFPEVETNTIYVVHTEWDDNFIQYTFQITSKT